MFLILLSFTPFQKFHFVSILGAEPLVGYDRTGRKLLVDNFAKRLAPQADCSYCRRPIHSA